MNTKEFTEGVLATESKVDEAMIKRISNPKFIRLNHAISGMVTEAGEAEDALKKHIYYGSELDETNIIEEIGDSLYYIALACDVLKLSVEDIMLINHNKLKSRYGDKFSKRSAEKRNLKNEAIVLKEQIDQQVKLTQEDREELRLKAFQRERKKADV